MNALCSVHSDDPHTNKRNAEVAGRGRTAGSRGRPAVMRLALTGSMLAVSLMSMASVVPQFLVSQAHAQSGGPSAAQLGGAPRPGAKPGTTSAPTQRTVQAMAPGTVGDGTVGGGTVGGGTVGGGTVGGGTVGGGTVGGGTQSSAIEKLESSAAQQAGSLLPGRMKEITPAQIPPAQIPPAQIPPAQIPPATANPPTGSPTEVTASTASVPPEGNRGDRAPGQEAPAASTLPGTTESETSSVQAGQTKATGQTRPTAHSLEERLVETPGFDVVTEEAIRSFIRDLETLPPDDLVRRLLSERTRATAMQQALERLEAEVQIAQQLADHREQSNRLSRLIEEGKIIQREFELRRADLEDPRRRAILYGANPTEVFVEERASEPDPAPEPARIDLQPPSLVAAPPFLAGGVTERRFADRYFLNGVRGTQGDLVAIVQTQSGTRLQVKAGDMIEDHKIIRISQSEMVLMPQDKQGEDVTLRLSFRRQ